jgi:hypothetical protein
VADGQARWSARFGRSARDPVRTAGIGRPPARSARPIGRPPVRSAGGLGLAAVRLYKPTAGLFFSTSSPFMPSRMCCNYKKFVLVAPTR